jgi:hypothetical protein
MGRGIDEGGARLSQFKPEGMLPRFKDGKGFPRERGEGGRNPGWRLPGSGTALKQQGEKTKKQKKTPHCTPVYSGTGIADRG